MGTLYYMSTSVQFVIENKIRARRDRDKHGKGFTIFVIYICKRIKQFEIVTLESIWSEITISKIEVVL